MSRASAASLRAAASDTCGQVPSVNFAGLPLNLYLSAQLLLPLGCTTRNSPRMSEISRRVVPGFAASTASAVKP